MSRPFTPKVLTANDLIEGDAVWLTPRDEWSRNMADAELLEDEAVAQDRLLFAIAQSDVVVGAYLVDAKASDAGPAPVHFREEFRTRGPSNYPHGKQVGA
ncbi:DUF2849 domain-containing protein [Boseongicola aestuarii]|jgi:hypothetical protein|uniref:Uncharacterized protein n=1 Tax=Boseongicola aestuarii TaxID=1470561 RepID=A0A238J0Z1_9RHOB|nr:DUF2849 domain-containing protein [Boseongicola aestuarii]SMX24399.1 hypothetical protein BOA8489_02523 [Boseongicola aestuarii]